MTIEQIANRIIKEIKAWPQDARLSQDVGGPKTSWDEYKEQVQYEEYDSFEVFEETIESMVKDEVSELSLIIIEKIYRSIYDGYISVTFEERRKEIVGLVLSHIKDEAKIQDIKYTKPDVEFVRYYVADLTIVAKVVEQVGPEEFLIRSYSIATGSSGEQGVANLYYLDCENRMERITIEEYEREKKGFNVKRLLQAEADLEHESRPDKLLNNENNADCILTQKDQLHNPVLVLENNAAKEKAQTLKALTDLVKLISKATKRHPLAVIRGLKYNLVDLPKTKMDQGSRK